MGIPDTLEEEGSTYQGIPYVMSFGGAKNFMKRSKGEIGKFGIGLSATITCLTREFGRATVWSQNAGNAEGRSVTYRFDDVVANDCMLPPEETKPRPKFTDATTGTVVELVLEDSAHMRPGAMQTRFLKFLDATTATPSTEAYPSPSSPCQPKVNPPQRRSTCETRWPSWRARKRLRNSAWRRPTMCPRS